MIPLTLTKEQENHYQQLLQDYVRSDITGNQLEKSFLRKQLTVICLKNTFLSVVERLHLLMKRSNAKVAIICPSKNDLLKLKLLLEKTFGSENIEPKNQCLSSLGTEEVSSFNTKNILLYTEPNLMGVSFQGIQNVFYIGVSNKASKRLISETLALSPDDHHLYYFYHENKMDHFLFLTTEQEGHKSEKPKKKTSLLKVALKPKEKSDIS